MPLRQLLEGALGCSVTEGSGRGCLSFWVTQQNLQDQNQRHGNYQPLGLLPPWSVSVPLPWISSTPELHLQLRVLRVGVRWTKLIGSLVNSHLH